MSQDSCTERGEAKGFLFLSATVLVRHSLVGPKFLHLSGITEIQSHICQTRYAFAFLTLSKKIEEIILQIFRKEI